MEMAAAGGSRWRINRRVQTCPVGKNPGRNLSGAWRMIAIDTNLLVFAHRGNAPDHQAALAALQPIIEGSSAWALPWPCVHEFISVTTNLGIYKPASTLSE